MSKEFKLADPGEGLHEAEILEIHASAGDRVEEGEVLLTVETDKASTEIPAPFSGTIDDIRVAVGDTAEVGDVLMTYDGGDGGDAENEQASDTPTRQDRDSDEAQKDSEIRGGNEEPAPEENRSDSQRPKHEKNVEMGDIEPEGKHDNTKDDETRQAPKQRQKNDNQDEPDERNHNTPVPAAPSTRRLAREKNVELGDIEPSGKHGRVIADDVEAAAHAAASQKEQGGRQRDGHGSGATLIPGGGEGPDLPDFSQWGEIERMPLRSIRRATARNMARSWSQIPHVYHQDIADVTELERFRRDHAAEHGKLTLTVLVMKALAGVLQRFPRFNASLDTDNREIVLKHYCHVGLAVATDTGLLVPVIRDVDRKSVTELAGEAADVAQQARDGKLGRADMQGASITVTNPGPMGGSSLTPLINHPQVAILGMARARLQPTIQGDLDDYQVVPRLHLPLILGFDHRVNDGADAARFVTTLIDALADPESLLLAV